MFLPKQDHFLHINADIIAYNYIHSYIIGILVILFVYYFFVDLLVFRIFCFHYLVTHSQRI